MDYTIEIPVDSGDSLALATVTAVDDNDTALVGDSLVISSVIPGQISDTLWGVSFLATGGTPGTTYRLRCRYTLSGSPELGSDKTVRLHCDNT